jgi:DinB superfamily
MRSLHSASDLARLTTRLGRLTPQQPRVWGSMSAHQMARHVGDALEAVLGRRSFPTSGRRPSTVRKLLALRVLPRWPHGVRAGADPAAAVLDPATFEADRERAIERLRELAGAPPEILTPDHPLFGAMSRADWMRWAHLHTDHHLRQFDL